MTKIAVVLLTGIMALSALLFAAHQVGVRAALPLAILRQTPDGNPCTGNCLMGVRPGVTSTDEAIALLEAHPLFQQGTWRARTVSTLNSAGVIKWRDEQRCEVAIEFEVQQQLVYGVSLTCQNSTTPTFTPRQPFSRNVRVTFGDLVALYGVPELHYRDYYFNNSSVGIVGAHIMAFDSLHLSYAVQSTRFKVLRRDDPVVNIRVYTAASRMDLADKTWWRGFGIYR